MDLCLARLVTSGSIHLYMHGQLYLSRACHWDDTYSTSCFPIQPRKNHVKIEWTNSINFLDYVPRKMLKMLKGMASVYPIKHTCNDD